MSIPTLFYSTKHVSPSHPETVEKTEKYFIPEENVKIVFYQLSGDARYPLLGQPLQYNPPAVLHGHIPAQQV